MCEISSISHLFYFWIFQVYWISRLIYLFMYICTWGVLVIMVYITTPRYLLVENDSFLKMFQYWLEGLGRLWLLSHFYRKLNSKHYSTTRLPLVLSVLIWSCSLFFRAWSCCFWYTFSLPLSSKIFFCRFLPLHIYFFALSLSDLSFCWFFHLLVWLVLIRNFFQAFVPW